MKKFYLALSLFNAICLTLTFTTSLCIVRYVKPNVVKETQESKLEEVDDWEIFRQALIQVESEGDSTATNKRTGAYGLYQLLPKGGYIDEYNRLTKSNIDIEDVKTTEMQHEVFNVVQLHRNPNKSFKKALELHNPRAMNPNYMSTYEYRVMYWFYKFKYENLTKEK